MNKQSFIENLRRELGALPSTEVEEIIRDQEEFLRDAIHAGRTEEQAVNSLGTPKAFAANLLAESKIQKMADTSAPLRKRVGSSFGAVFAILALAPLNLIFVLGPFIGAVGVLVGGWATAISVALAASAGILAFLFKCLFLPLSIFVHGSAIFFLLGFLSLGLLGTCCMFIVTKFFITLTVHYLRWNLHFIQKA